MFALNSHFWVHKCSRVRHISGIVATMSKIKLETPQTPHSLTKHTVKDRQCELVRVTNFHTCGSLCRDLLMKMLNKKKKKKWYETVQPVQLGQSGFLTPAKKKNPVESQRVRILNIVVYKAVSDLLASHEISAEIPNYSVEITKVSFTANFSSCRVYWKTSFSADRDSKIQKILDKSAPRVRYLLMSLQILSNVPPLVFIQDKKYAAMREVENLLEIADYGPSEETEHLSLDGKDTETGQQSVESLEKKKPLWFGIDHDALLKQIKDYQQQTQARDLETSSSSPALTQEQLHMLAEIRKQKLIEKKKRKSKKLRDDDISPKDFLLARQLQNEEHEGEYSSEQGSEEDSQDSELMGDYRKH